MPPEDVDAANAEVEKLLAAHMSRPTSPVVTAARPRSPTFSNKAGKSKLVEGLVLFEREYNPGSFHSKDSRDSPVVGDGAVLSSATPEQSSASLQPHSRQKR